VVDGLTFEACDFSDAVFDRALIRNSVFRMCTFLRCVIQGTTFENVEFTACQFAGTHLDGDVFIACQLEDFCTYSEVYAGAPSTIDWRSILKSSRALHLEQFLIKCGMPELFATYQVACATALGGGGPLHATKAMPSTFISYGAPDSEFAQLLQRELQRRRVSTFFFPEHALAGMKLHDVMRNAVNSCDHVVLICSRLSLDRPGVQNEIEQALAREARDGGRSYLVPITLDDYIFAWNPKRLNLAQEIRDRVVADFRGAPAGSARFYNAVSRLIDALNA
jgi:hypothetical protein